ncbi:MAG: hypothetical protein EPN91_06890 [Salinibacterium sp.]|nr:MAG: hypothetical protein EPN91_06890 [Salinibacterium sp.]
MVRELAPKSGYVTVTDKTAQREEQITRYDFDDAEELRIINAEVAIRLQRPDEADEEDHTLDGEAEDDADDEADPGNPPDDDEDEAASELRQDLLISRCLAQIRRYAEGCMAGETAKVFRARCFMPKASTCLGSKQFVLRNIATYAAGDGPPVPAAAAAPASPLATVPLGKDAALNGATPAYDLNIGLASVNGFRALGEQYRLFGNMVLTGAERIAKVQEGNVGTLTKELTDARGVIDQLLATIVTLRGVDATSSEKAASAMSEAERSKLGKQAIETIGDVGKAFLVSRGLTPEAVIVLNAVGANPRLTAFLGRKDVQEYLRDEREVDALIAMLDAAIQHRAASQKAAASNNGSAASPA